MTDDSPSVYFSGYLYIWKSVKMNWRCWRSHYYPWSRHHCVGVIQTLIPRLVMNYSCRGPGPGLSSSSWNCTNKDISFQQNCLQTLGSAVGSKFSLYSLLVSMYRWYVSFRMCGMICPQYLKFKKADTLFWTPIPRNYPWQVKFGP